MGDEDMLKLTHTNQTIKFPYDPATRRQEARDQSKAFFAGIIDDAATWVRNGRWPRSQI